MVEGAVGLAQVPSVSGLEEVARTLAATTYRGEDDAGRRVVVKVLHRDADAGVRARFDYDQARLAELAEHPDVVTTLDHGYTEGNQPYLVMEELTGGSLADQVGAGMDGPSVLAVGVKLAGALESAHRRNLVHGDLRPEDVLVTPDGEPHLADLGIALVTGIGPDRATSPARIAHAAPEQLATHLPTPATDVYALGSVLHALLAGSPAFVSPDDTSPMAVALRITNDAPPDLRAVGVPEPVVEVIARAMAKDPAARWESAEAMGHALQQAEVALGRSLTPMTVIGADLSPPRPVEREEPAPVAAAPPAAAGSPAAAAPSAAPPPAAPEAPPASPAPSAWRSRLPVLIGAGVLAVVAIAAFLLVGRDDGDGDDDRSGFERPEEEGADLEAVSDDDGVISVGVIERWDEVDGRNLPIAEGVVASDLIAAEDAEGFLQRGGVTISGIEVTVLEVEALAAAGLPSEAAALLADRVANRGLADACSSDLEPQAAEIGGFQGQRQRFEECDGGALEVFAGVDQGGRALVVEVHLVDDDDQAALEDVLGSISIS
jgi:hypothetical protein